MSIISDDEVRPTLKPIRSLRRYRRLLVCDVIQAGLLFAVIIGLLVTNIRLTETPGDVLNRIDRLDLEISTLINKSNSETSSELRQAESKILRQTVQAVRGAGVDPAPVRLNSSKGKDL